MSRIDVALGFDGRYAPHAGTVVSSIVRNAPGAAFRFLLLHMDVTSEMKARVESVAPGAEFLWIEVGEDDLPAHADRGHFNRTILFRLGLETLAPTDCARVIYIDSDMVVLGDVRELWRAALGVNAMGAVVDGYVAGAEFAQRWDLAHTGECYFNSGLLVIDLAKVREQKLFSRTLDFVVEHDTKLLFSDQDALNHVFWGRWTPLDPAWNVQKFLNREEIAQELKGAALKLVHFTGTRKPWMADIWHPWAWLYWDAVRHTPFKDDVAREFGVTPFHRARYRLRWLLKRPQTSARSV
jgi:lipopolysaccharide biosynthesis glycosyltransferase